MPTSSATVWRRLFEVAATPLFVFQNDGAVRDLNPAAAHWIDVERVPDFAEGPGDDALLAEAFAAARSGRDADLTLALGTALAFRPLGDGVLVERTAAAVASPDPSFQARAALGALVGHLELLPQAGLSAAQIARIEAAVETAVGLADQFGESAGEGLPALARPPRRVLVVDDDEVNRYLLTDALAALHTDATAVADAQDALDLLAAQPYDLVLMDVMMPGLDGIEATRRLRARGGAQPVIVGLTAAPETRQRCLDAGMDGFVTKPIRLSVLAELLDRGDAERV